jgi:hypothetical protein
MMGKLTQEVVEQLRKLLPEEFHDKAFVAGGYAHNPEKAEDIDLWVVGQEDMEATANKLRGFNDLPDIGDINDPAYEVNPHGFVVAFNRQVVENDDDEFSTNIVKVQVIVTKQPDIDTLLSYFDITTHKIAYPLAAPTTFRVGEGYFPIGVQPRVTRFDSPAHTLKRLQKIAARYGFDPHPEDVEELVKLGAPRAA